MYLVQLQNYLLFHAIVEMFAIVIACGIFVVAFTGRKYLENGYLVFLGIAYLFVGLLDLLHVLGYPGMGVFADYDYYANQLWVAARYVESVSLLLATIMLRLPSGSLARHVGHGTTVTLRLPTVRA